MDTFHYILVVIIVKIVIICSFLFYCFLFNHSSQTNPNSVTNCFKFFSLSLLITLTGTSGDMYEQLQDIFETNVRAMPKNPAKIAMMLDPEYDDGGIPLFYTFVLDGLFERILPLLQPNFEACKLLSFLFFS